MASKTREDFLPIREETRERVDTVNAAYWLGRSPKTLRNWATEDSGPIKPIRIARRLAWSVQEIRQLLEVQQ